MILHIPNIIEKNIILFDIEYDHSTLIQMAFLILTKIESNMFILSKSLNLYVNPGRPLSNFFTRYTHITDEFLRDNGVDLTVARSEVSNALFDIDPNNTIIVSHGLKNDLDLLYAHGIDLKQIKTHFCTYNNAKKILKRDTSLNLTCVAAEGGYYAFNEHNAYADAWSTLHAFCALKEKYISQELK